MWWRVTSWVGVENLNSVAGCQSLLQQWGELLRELLPVLLPDLLLEAVQDLQEQARKKSVKKVLQLSEVEIRSRFHLQMDGCEDITS